ncbi:FKBP-type peptidyl-prolyl cis-trans isomerase [Pedobacter polaris]|uniref:Peptidyl-prolyl cis-trans isomerase n=1 Tax=Pedobacter polaris TaxID=2571273 RepID=A0A4U1CU25_9SPHI|nr:FKBP-type peptidyl-prolyl cis-trans isomerase [Pedobacter polaris]TKC12086.1 FKBP-type peptidyl-prolyl cis-trans isomerase [Pedobacter polaris]
MKKIFVLAIISMLSYSVNAQKITKTNTVAKKPTSTVKNVSKVVPNKAPLFRTTLDSASYALGVNVASSFKSGGMSTLNYELFNKGLKDIFAKANPLLSQEKCQEAVNNLFMSFSKQRESEDMKKYAPNVKAGADFLAANKTKAGVKTTASGLQYEVITQGTGAQPKSAADQVTVNYKGTLLDGYEFDSSYKRGTPATFGLNQVIAAWTEGLQLMQEGSKYRFFVPYNLGYGSREAPGGAIPPFSTLIFEVELIKVGQ